MSWIGNDICWCGNSYEHFKDDSGMKCTHTDCFRHMINRTPEPGPEVFTMSMLKDTELCPYYEKEKEN